MDWKRQGKHPFGASRLIRKRPDGLFILAFLLVAAGIVVVLASRSGGTPSADARVSLAETASKGEGAGSRTVNAGIRFAIAAVLSPRRTLENYEGLASYLGRQLGQPVQVVQGRNYAEINALVRSGDVTLALVCSGAFVNGRKDFGMRPLVIPVIDGERTYHSYLIVRPGGGFRKWEDLRGATFAFTDPLSNSGRLVPVYTLSQMGETPDSFFSDAIFTYSHDRSIIAVAEGLVDAAAVDSLVYNHMTDRDPEIAAKTSVVWESPPYGINPVVVRPGLDPALKADLERVLMGMASHPEGKRILDRIGIDGFDAPAPGAYEQIEAMIQATAGKRDADDARR